MFNRLKLSVLRRIRARIALSIYEILQITARVLGDDGHSRAYLMERATEIYANPARFEDFLRTVGQSENFSAFALKNLNAAAPFVKLVFNLVLGRDPEPEALNAFSGAISNGELSYDDFCREIMNSAEAKSRVEVSPKLIYFKCLTAASSVVGKPDVDLDQIDRLAYNIALSRINPKDAFNEILRQGPGIAQGHLLNDADLADIMRDVYQASYNRPPTDPELANWRERIRHGNASLRDFVRQVIESEEAVAYRRRKAS